MNEEMNEWKNEQTIEPSNEWTKENEQSSQPTNQPTNLWSVGTRADYYQQNEQNNYSCTFPAYTPQEIQNNTHISVSIVSINESN